MVHPYMQANENTIKIIIITPLFYGHTLTLSVLQDAIINLNVHSATEELTGGCLKIGGFSCCYHEQEKTWLLILIITHFSDHGCSQKW